MRIQESADIAIIGAGIAGIAAAYYLAGQQAGRVCLVDAGSPMFFTSAQSGDNFRNWWPHTVMTQFTDYSIDLLEEINEKSGNRINLNHDGYLLATRDKDIDELVAQLHRGYGQEANSGVRVHSGPAPGYLDSLHAHAVGVDIVDRKVIDAAWPHIDPRVEHIIHIRRAGDIDGQQLGQYMLEQARENGAFLMKGKVIALERDHGFRINLDDGREIRAEIVICAAGPFTNMILANIGETLPVINVLQQKLAFEDVEAAIPRDQPFVVDLDAGLLDWSNEERVMLENEAEYRWLGSVLPAGTHSRPEGGIGGKWVKLGWAFNKNVTEPEWNPPLDELFPEIVMRGAARLIPALKGYCDHMPDRRSHYGGYYTMTDENWPIIGPLETPGAFVIGALSGFGSMAACAAGSLCARWVCGGVLPDYAADLSLKRYGNKPLMAELKTLAEKGLL